MRLLAIFIAFVLSACTTVELDEKVLFQGKATIVPSDFPSLGYELRPQTLAVEGATLDGWYLDRPDEKATVLYFGGQGFHLVNARPEIELWAELEVDVLVFDYRGYGKSTGEPTVPKLKADALVIWLHAVEKLGVSHDRVIVHGHSMGTFIASYVATKHEPAGLILESPATDAEAWKSTVIPLLLRIAIDFEIPESVARESNLTRLGELELPLLIAVGDADKITPPELARELHQAARSKHNKLVVVEGAGHNDLSEHSKYQKAYRAFLSTFR